MGTAAQHFPQLLEIAVPGPFFFCGDVPEQLKQAAIGRTWEPNLDNIPSVLTGGIFSHQAITALENAFIFPTIEGLEDLSLQNLSIRPTLGGHSLKT
jgi:hypothetical protein